MARKIYKHWNKKILPAISVSIGKRSIWFPFSQWEDNKKEAEELASFISDSLNVYEETGKTPSEILQRNKTLESTIKTILELKNQSNES